MHDYQYQKSSYPQSSYHSSKQAPYYEDTHKQCQQKIKKLEHDNQELSRAISDLNQCYAHKVRIMEDTITDQQSRIEDLLQWKHKYVDNSLFQVEKYQLEIKNMIHILDNAHKHFQHQNESFHQQIQMQNQSISALRQENQRLGQENESFREENESLKVQNCQQEIKLNGIAMKYIQQIERLNFELKELKEEGDEKVEEGHLVLKDISNHTLSVETNEKHSRITHEQEQGQREGHATATFQ